MVIDMTQWSKDKKNTWVLVEDKLKLIDKIRDELLGVSRGTYPVYKDGMTPQELGQRVEERCARLRQDLFRESIALIDLQRIFHAFDT